MKVCFVGAGSIGKRHIKNLKKISQMEGFLVEIHLLRSSHKLLEKEINDIVSKQFYLFEDVDEYYDAVFVTNPTYLHYETVLMWSEKAKFFFVEKPVFDNWNMDISMFNCNSHNVYYVACPLRYTKVLQAAQVIINQNSIYSARAICSSYLPDWRPGIDYRDTYSAKKEQGGGVKIDLIHEWDYLIHLFGFPKRVYEMDGKYSDLEINSEDIAIYIAQYDNQLLELHLDYFGKKEQRYLEIMTQDAVYTFDIANNCIMKNGTVIEEFEEDSNDKYMREMYYFYELVNGKVENVNNIMQAVNVMKVANNEAIKLDR